MNIRRRKIPSLFDVKQPLIALKDCVAEGVQLKKGTPINSDKVSLNGRVRLWCRGVAEYECDCAPAVLTAGDAGPSVGGDGDAKEGSAIKKPATKKAATKKAASAKPKADEKPTKAKKGLFGFGRAKKAGK